MGTIIITMQFLRNTLFLVAAFFVAVAAVDLASFGGQSGATHSFVELNDPVMGGRSTGTWKVSGSTGIFDGQVVDVPSLKAPGFIKASARDAPFADVSSAISGDLVLEVKTTTPEYKGFRVSFASGSLSPSYSCAGGGGLPGSRGCFKAKFSVPAGDDFTEVRIPFNQFSDKWSSATGEQTKTCSEDSDVCPTAEKLARIQSLEVWAEGALGKVHLEIKSISASVKATSTAFASATAPVRPPAQYDTCTAAVQSSLRYNISTLDGSYITAPVPDLGKENLATAICCDNRTKVF